LPIKPTQLLQKYLKSNTKNALECKAQKNPLARACKSFNCSIKKKKDENIFESNDIRVF
jgi:hypothetical protein